MVYSRAFLRSPNTGSTQLLKLQVPPKRKYPRRPNVHQALHVLLHLKVPLLHNSRLKRPLGRIWRRNYRHIRSGPELCASGGQIMSTGAGG